MSRSFPLPLRVGREPEIHFVRQELGADCGDQTMTREDRAVKLSHRLPPWEGVVAASMCLSVSENPATILYLVPPDSLSAKAGHRKWRRSKPIV